MKILDAADVGNSGAVLVLAPYKDMNLIILPFVWIGSIKRVMYLCRDVYNFIGIK